MTENSNMDVNLSGMLAGDCLGELAQRPQEKTPFAMYIFPDFLDQNSNAQLREDIKSCVRLKPKDNDLYKFKQSKDLKSEIQIKKLTPTINKFTDVMLEQVREHLEKATGLKLSNRNFDITVSRYEPGNYLLCHNDDIKIDRTQGGRALAFIYYLNTLEWTETDGGSLVLYNSDSTGEPISVNNKISPRPNTLIVFKTGPTSWHSVEEVCRKDDLRLSINGWFHYSSPVASSSNKCDDKTIELCPFKLTKPLVIGPKIEFFSECVSKEYLMNKTCYLIRKKFKRKSEINLSNFLVKEKYEEISNALKEAASQEENLTHVGPYNKRNYKTLKVERLPKICQDLYEAFQSELFYMLLSRMTGLDLLPPSMMSTGKTQGKSGEDDEDDDEDSDDDDLSDEESSDDDEDDDDDDDDDNDEDDDDDGTQAPKKKKEEAPADGESVLDQVAQFVSGGESAAANNQQPKEAPKKRKRISDPLARLEFRHLEHGSYTLIHDFGFELGERSALDVILHFNHDFAVNFEDGGYISYIDAAPDDDPHDMDCELLTVDPKSNCLSLVYRCDEGTCRFLKHVSKSHKSSYQDLCCVFYERPDDLPNLGFKRA